MLAFFKRPTVLAVFGLTLLSLFIWYTGELFAFGDSRPLETPAARLIAIALVGAFWVGLTVIRRLKAKRASAQLVAAVVDQSKGDARPSAEVVQLRERFEEAVATLQKGQRGGRSLYELPWYMIIGAPGSGKTTVLVNSGLHFPMEQRMGKGALRGVGGTRNCDWWFTDEAVFLDTAGRYTTQDSDESADSAAWAEFLALLNKYRKRRPVNGVILTVSARDLMLQGAAEQEAYVASARRRLDELQRELKIQLPVYLLVTKCDLVAGFTEYFDDLNQDGRAQVWGATFSYDQTLKGEAAGAVAGEFETLMRRLNERLLPRLEEERDVRKRARIFAFPQQMAVLGDALSAFVTDVFRSTKFDRTVLLRGFYCTSGTQEGTPIDRLVGALGRRFALSAEAVAPPAGRGKAYFIERFLNQVLLAESGLAGVNRGVEVRKAALQLGAYIGVAAVAALLVIAFSVSYTRNRAYLKEISEGAEQVRGALAQSAGASVVDRLDLIGAVVDAADLTPVPWSMRWGLYQGRALGNAARDAYARELNGNVLTQVVLRIKNRLENAGGDSLALIRYLKAYLMLGDHSNLDKAFLADVMKGLEWDRSSTTSAEDAAALAGHFERLLAFDTGLRPAQIDMDLVARVRLDLPDDARARLVYDWIRLAYSDDTSGAVRLDSLGADVLRRRNGTPLQSVSSLYTKKVFTEVVTKTTAEMEKELAANSWVLGDSSSFRRGSVKDDVIALYEQDYIAMWLGVLDDVSLAPVSGNIAQLKKTMAVLAAPTTSPLRRLFKIVDDNTYLLEAAPPAAGGIKQKLDEVTNKALRRNTSPTATPAANVTKRFEAIHLLMAGGADKAPVDSLIALVGDLNNKFKRAGDDVVGGMKLGPEELVAIKESSQALAASAETLPAAIGAVVTELGSMAVRVAGGEAGRSLRELYQDDVVRVCERLVAGKYPLTTSNQPDVQMPDFGQVFGPQGVFDRFFQQNLDSLVNKTGGRYTWKSGGPIGLPAGLLTQFQRARDIRETFFTSKMEPDVPFSVDVVDLDKDATKFTLEINGQSHVFQHNAVPTLSVAWPGTSAGAAAATFDNRSGRRPHVSATGPWSWFRLLDARESTLVAETDSRYLLTIRTGGHEARVRVQAHRALNPFGKAIRLTLSQFSCQS